MELYSYEDFRLPQNEFSSRMALAQNEGEFRQRITKVLLLLLF